MQTNEIFLLVGEVIAQIVAAASDTAAAVDTDVVSARAPFADFVQEPWWDVAAPRAGNSIDGSVDSRASVASLPETLRGLCEESSALLRSAFATLPQAVLREELTAERFGRVVGMFEQNNVGVRVSSPVAALLGGVVAGPELSGASVDELVGLVSRIEEFQESESDCDSGDEGGEEESGKVPAVEQEERMECRGLVAGGEEKKGSVDDDGAPSACAGKGCCAEDVGSASLGDDRIATLQKAAATERPDEMFAPLDGTALYSLVCCMNHSCRPNCVVRYPRGICSPSSNNSADTRALPLVAQVVLIEEAAAGDELTQSYVDKDMGLLERRKALEDYGFLCRCPRCLEEEATAT